MDKPKKPIGFEWMSQADNVCPKPWVQNDLLNMFNPLVEEGSNTSKLPCNKTQFVIFKSTSVMDSLRRRIAIHWPSTLPSKRLKLAKHVFTHGFHPWEHMSNQQLMRRRFVYHSTRDNPQEGIQHILALTRLAETFLAGRVELTRDPPSDLITSQRRHLMEYGFPQIFGIDLDANNIPIGFVTDDYGMRLYDLSSNLHCDILGILQEMGKLMMHMHSSGVFHNDISPSCLTVFMSRMEHGTVVEHFLPKGNTPFVLQQTIVYKLIGFDKCRLETLPAPCLAVSASDLGRFADSYSLLQQPPVVNDVHHSRITPPSYVHPSQISLNDDILRLGQTLVAIAIKGHVPLRPESVGYTDWQQTIQFVEKLLHYTASPNRLFEFLLFTKHCIATLLRCQARPAGEIDDRVIKIFQYMFPVHETEAPENVKLPDFVTRTKFLLSRFHEYALGHEDQAASSSTSDDHPIDAMLRLDLQDELDAWWLSLNSFVLLSERLVDINNHTHQLFDVQKKTFIHLPVLDEPEVFINLEAVSIADMSMDINKAEFSIYPMEPAWRIACTTTATAHCLREMTAFKRSDRIGALPLLLKTRRFTADSSVVIEEVVEPFGVLNLHTAKDIFYAPCASRFFQSAPQIIKRTTLAQRLLTSFLSIDITVLHSLSIDPNGMVPSWLFHSLTIFEDTTRMETMASDVLTDTWVLLFVSSLLMAHRLFSNTPFVANHYACCGLLIADAIYSDTTLWHGKQPMSPPGGDSNVWHSLMATFADSSTNLIAIPESELIHINGMRTVLETMETMLLTTCQWRLPQSRYAILFDLVAPSMLHDQRVLLSRLLCQWMGDELRLTTELDPRLVLVTMIDAVVCWLCPPPTTPPSADPIQSESVIANAMLLRSSKTLHFHMITSIYEMPESTFTTLLIPICRVMQSVDRHLQAICPK